MVIIKSAIILFVSLTAFLNANDLDMKKPSVTADLQQEVNHTSLTTKGDIPNWLSGTLVRNGPVNVTINGERNAHWFDGLAMLHAFSFREGQVHYSNKFLRSDAYHAVFDKGSLEYKGFAVDPCRSVFKKFFTFFVPQSHHEMQNANVNVAKLAGEYVALTETPLPVKFDLQTLETLGVLDFQDDLPKKKCWESAHPHSDLQKDAVNYLIEYGKTSYYTLYNITHDTLQRDVIAKVPVSEPAYMHSFALTEHYIILTEFPFVVKPLDLMIKNLPFIKNFTWQPERGTRFIVIERKSGIEVGTFTTKPFFAFHHANAFENGKTIYLDIVTYKDAKIITGDDLYNSDKTAHNYHPSQVERFSLSLPEGTISSEVLLSTTSEFPRINEQYDGRPYRYLYVASFDDDKIESKGLTKIDTQTKEVKEWHEEGCSPGEPIFVSAPEGKAEDDGVILIVVVDHLNHTSFLLILDAQSFAERGRAYAPHLIPAGLHSQFFQ